MMFIFIGSASLNILLNFLLVPRYGIYGAAYATIATYFIATLVKYYYSKGCYFVPLKWRELIPYFLIFTCLFFLFRRYDHHLNIYLNIALKTSISIALAMLMIKRYIGFSNLMSAINLRIGEDS